LRQVALASKSFGTANLHDLGIDDHTIKAILWHSLVTVTQRSFIKPWPKHSIAAMETFDGSIAKVVHSVAQIRSARRIGC